MCGRRALPLAAIVVAALTLAASAAARFDSAAAAGATVSSGTLAAPTGSAATQVSCRNNKPPQISIGWTASTSSFVTGYTIERGTTSGGPYTAIGSVSAASSSFADPSTTLAYSTRYYYVVVATFKAWTAGSSEASATTRSSTCK